MTGDTLRPPGGRKYPLCCPNPARSALQPDNSKKCSRARMVRAARAAGRERRCPASAFDPRRSRTRAAGGRALAGDGKLAYVSTEVMPDSDLKVHEDLKVDTSHGDHERFAHYVDKNDMMQAAVFGTPIKALCGKVWVPSRDPQKFPVCPECKEIYESLPPGDDDE